MLNKYVIKIKLQTCILLIFLPYIMIMATVRANITESDTLSSAHPRPAAAVAPLVFVPKHVAIGLRVNSALLINIEL